jgi:monoamine oxidase
MFYKKFIIIYALIGSNLLFGSVTKPSNPKIVIVGAGIGGLTTAYQLYKCGLDVEVYEARNRVGGRIFTAFINDKIVEFGGQNVHDGGRAENIHKLIDELDLSTTSRKASLNPICIEDNSPVQVNDILKTYHLQGEKLRNKLEDLATNACTMRDIIEKLFDQNEFQDRVLYRYADSLLAAYRGAPAEFLSTLDREILYHTLSQDACFTDAAPLDHTSVKGGNSKLTQALADILGSRVHLNMPLLAISKNEEDAYELVFEKEVVQADIVVLAMPCSVYKDIEFEESVIPHKRLEKIKNVRYGTNAKMMIPLEGKINSKQNIFNKDFVSLFNISNDILVLYYIKDAGYFTEETVKETYQKIISYISPLFGNIPSDTAIVAFDQSFNAYDGPVGYSWQNDPFAQGSYSYIAAGQEKILTEVEKVNGTLVKSLFAPIHNTLYFVGEHCALPELEEIATMQGACDSGIRAATMIQSSLKAHNILTF